MIFRVAKWRFLALVLALVAVFGFEVWGIATPSMWADEVATVAASSRSLGHLWAMVQNIDAVHGTYYLFMHFWGGAFGFSPFALRLPSALGITAAVLLTYCVALRLFGTRVAWYALVLAAVLPRMTWAATEARSYAIDALVGVGLTLLLLRATDEGMGVGRMRLRWLAYGVLLALGIHLFVFVLLLALSHGIWLLLRRREAMRGWLVSFAAAGLASSGVLWLVDAQKSQVGWLPPVSAATVSEVFEGQFFLSSPVLAYICTGLLIAVVFGAKNLGFSAQKRSSTLLLALTAALPPALILAYSLATKSIYDSRYFTFAAPMVAILLALALSSLFSAPLSGLSLALVVALSLPTYLQLRQPHAKDSNWAEIARQVALVNQPNTGILYADYARRSPSLSRIHIAYPSSFVGLKDFTLQTPFTQSHGLYDIRVTPEASVGKWRTCGRIIVVATDLEGIRTAHLKDLLRAKGFSQTQRHDIPGDHILVFEQQRKQ